MVSAIEIGQEVRARRKVMRLSQLELARLAGVGKTVVWDVEHGKATVRLETLRRLFRVLGLRLRLESEGW